MPYVIENKNREYAADFCEFLVPNYVEEGIVIEKINAVLPVVPEERVEVTRMYREQVDTLTRLKNGKALSIEYLARISS